MGVNLPPPPPPPPLRRPGGSGLPVGLPWIIGGGILLVLLFLIVLGAAFSGPKPVVVEALTAPPSSSPSPEPVAEPTNDATDQDEPTSEPSPSPTPTPAPTVEAPTPTETPADTSKPAPATWLVTRVTDGDTFRVEDGPTKHTIRLAQVDAPETDECFGREAGEWLLDQVLLEDVVLERSTDGPDEDRYGRKVREAWLGSTSMNVEIVRRGYATHYASFSSEDPDLAARIAAAEKEARAKGRGLWSACVEAPPDPGGAHTGKTDGGWSCHADYRECLPAQLSDLDCGEIGHQVILFGNDDPWRLDGNSTTAQDGVGCESYPKWSSSTTYPYY
jgi:endonuclease YncB( thermonuclease family)